MRLTVDQVVRIAEKDSLNLNMVLRHEVQSKFAQAADLNVALIHEAAV